MERKWGSLALIVARRSRPASSTWLAFAVKNIEKQGSAMVAKRPSQRPGTGVLFTVFHGRGFLDRQASAPEYQLGYFS